MLQSVILKVMRRSPIPCSMIVSCTVIISRIGFIYHGNETEVTLVSVTTYSPTFPLMISPSRLFFIPYLLQRWEGPYSLVIYCSSAELDSAITSYRQMNVPRRMSALFYSYSPKNVYAKDFPVNLLRNLGIRLVRTNHFLMLDMWVNCNAASGVSRVVDMYKEIHRIPQHLMDDDANLFIIPTVFLNKYKILKTCNSLRKCVLKYEHRPD